jgi:fructose-bisphosphate aldolase class I
MTSDLHQTALALVAASKGILAADESQPTIQKRFDSVGIPNTEQERLNYRQMLFTTNAIESFISGVILFDETVWQVNKDGVSLHDLLEEKNIISGVKVDEGKIPAPNSPQESITQGLTNLEERLAKYKAHGMRFTKWRAAILIAENLPTDGVIDENARLLAEFAYLSQQSGLVPIVEPEVLMDGSHPIDKCEEVTTKVLTKVFAALQKKNVLLEGMLLKPNFIVPGGESGQDIESSLVASKTLKVLEECVPQTVPGIVFLSGGLSPQKATLYLNELNKSNNHPWQLSFSFGRALQGPALKAWAGKPENVKMAQEAFYKRARFASLARSAQYKEELEND